jgi:hypothetical protein
MKPSAIQKLFAIIVALAVLFAPSVAYAAVPMTAHHEAQAMEMGHCEMLPSKNSEHDKGDGKSCCISMCMAVAVAPSSPAEAAEARNTAVYFITPQSWHGFLGEIATPPPRMT